MPYDYTQFLMGLGTASELRRSARDRQSDYSMSLPFVSTSTGARCKLPWEELFVQGNVTVYCRGTAQLSYEAT